MSSPNSSAAADAESAKQKVAACEKDISGIKARLRALGPATAEEGAAANSLTVAWIKTEGLPDAVQPRLKLQLSSPIEDAELTSLFDPLATLPDGSRHNNPTTHVFRGVETGQATLTVTATDGDSIFLGTSIAYDVEKLVVARSAADSSEPISHDDSETQPPLAIVETELLVAIYPPTEPEPSSTPSDETTTSPPPADTTNNDNTMTALPICTVTLRLTFEPSLKDKREELYERLNEASRLKANAVEQLRQVALAASRQHQQQQLVKPHKPAVEAGFLNKKKPVAEQKSKLQQWYDQHLGPNSILRRVGPVARNYIFFVGVVTFFHFQGQLFALPPPV